MTMTDTDEPEVTEITGLAAERVDGVKGAASGFRFILAKAASGPEAQAAVEALAKATISTADQNDEPDSDFAYIEPGGKKDSEGKTVPRTLRHFFIGDAAHVRDALGRAPQSPFGDKAMPKILAAAKKFGIEVSDDNTAKATTAGVTSETGIEGSPMADDGMKDCETCDGDGKIREGNVTCPDCKGSGKVADVAKVAAPAWLSADDLRAIIREEMAAKSAPVAKADGDGTVIVGGDAAPADDGVPGSESWEDADSACLSNAAAMLAAVETALEDATDREQTEVEAGQADDLDDVWDLQDALSALQAALGIVSRLAFQEAAEADAAAVAKGSAVVEKMASVVVTATGAAQTAAKAGKRLSTASEQSLKEAIATLTALLAGDGATADTGGTSSNSDDGPKGSKSDNSKGADGTKTSDNTEDDDMTDEQVAKMTQDIAAGVTAGLAEALKGLVPAPAATAAPVAKSEAPTADGTGAAPTSEGADAVTAKSLADQLAEAKAISARLEEQLAKAAQPQRGAGPLVSAPQAPAFAAGPFSPVTALTDPQRVYTESVAKAQAAPADIRGDATRQREMQNASLALLGAAYASGTVNRFPVQAPHLPGRKTA